MNAPKRRRGAYCPESSRHTVRVALRLAPSVAKVLNALAIEAGAEATRSDIVALALAELYQATRAPPGDVPSDASTDEVPGEAPPWLKAAFHVT